MRTQSKSAPGPDRLSGQVYKQLITSNVVLQFLHKEINTVLQTGSLPEPTRKRLIVPVPKASGGYRPISLLTVFSKIVDRIIADRLRVLMPIRDCQFGCRKGHSSQHALARVLHHAGLAAAKETQFALLCLDFSKAYDRVNPFILLQKLAKNGIPTYILRYTLNWIYNRSFKVIHHGTLSDEFLSINGLPQGSPLSVILWLMFINDIDIDEESSNIFMDDTAIWSTGDTLDSCIKSLNRKVRRIDRWCRENKVLLNVQKSGWIANTSDPDLTLQIRVSDNRIIPERRQLRYLGAIFKSSATTRVLLLDYNPLVGKLKRYNGLLRRVRHYLSEAHLLLFATALIQGKLNYFLPLLGMESDQLLEPLNVAWRETQRVISGALRSTYTPLLHHRTGLPPLKEIIDEQAGRLWLQIMTANKHILLTEYQAWDGFGDGSSPLGAVWKADRFLAASIQGGLEHLSLPPHQHLDILYACKFHIASSKRQAMELHNSNQLLPSDCYLQLWTDGSFIEGKGGASWIISNSNLIQIFKNSRGLSNVEHSYQCELFAITAGLWSLVNYLKDKNMRHSKIITPWIVVLSDCRSILLRLSSLPIYPRRLSETWISLIEAVVELKTLGFGVNFT